MKTENIIKLLDANLYSIQNEEMKNIEEEIQKAKPDGDQGYREAMSRAYGEAKSSLHTINWIRELFDKPDCYGEPNRTCYGSHDDTDEDCEYVKGCMRVFKTILSLSQTIIEKEERV